jgi:anaerobic selenocysteine-containing dehydrogenase
MTTPTKKKSKSRTSLSSPLAGNTYTHSPSKELKEYTKPARFLVQDAKMEESHIPLLRETRCYMNAQDMKAWNIQAGDYVRIENEIEDDVRSVRLEYCVTF